MATLSEALKTFESLRRLAGHMSTITDESELRQIEEASQKYACKCNNGANCVEPDRFRSNEGLIVYTQLVREKLAAAIAGGATPDHTLPEVDIAFELVSIDLTGLGNFRIQCDPRGWGITVAFEENPRRELLLAAFWMLGMQPTFQANAREICYAFALLIERTGLPEQKAIELATDSLKTDLDLPKIWLATYGLMLVEPRTKESEVLRLAWGDRLNERFLAVLQAVGHDAAKGLLAAVGDAIVLEPAEAGAKD